MRNLGKNGLKEAEAIVPNTMIKVPRGQLSLRVAGGLAQKESFALRNGFRKLQGRGHKDLWMKRRH